MVTDALNDSSDQDQRLATQRAQVAQYWQRCNDARADHKLERSLSTSNTHVIDDEDDDEDDDDEDDDDDVVDIDLDDADDDGALEYENRYVHYRRRTSRGGGASVVSGLPLLCGNCGVSFFSLQSVDDEDDCYCSGECKWSVIMYREMDRRMCTLHASRARSNGTRTYEAESDAPSRCQYAATDDGISCH